MEKPTVLRPWQHYMQNIPGSSCSGGSVFETSGTNPTCCPSGPQRKQRHHALERVCEPLRRTTDRKGSEAEYAQQQMWGWRGRPRTSAHSFMIHGKRRLKLWTRMRCVFAARTLFVNSPIFLSRLFRGMASKSRSRSACSFSKKSCPCRLTSQ